MGVDTHEFFLYDFKSYIHRNGTEVKDYLRDSVVNTVNNISGKEMINP